MNPPLQLPPNDPVQNTPGKPAEDLIPGWLALLGRSLLLTLALAFAAGMLFILHNALGSGEVRLSYREFSWLFRRADEPLAYTAAVAFYLAFLGVIVWAIWTEALPEAWRAFKKWRRIGTGNETPTTELPIGYSDAQSDATFPVMEARALSPEPARNPASNNDIDEGTER